MNLFYCLSNTTIHYIDKSITTHGANSPVAGGQITTRDIKNEVNTESPETKKLAVLGIKLSIRQLTWSIVGVLLALLIGLLTLKPEWMPF